jgi:immunity protein 8 of polymorphic toxin system
MRARLKSLRSDDISDLARFHPADPRSFAVPLVLEVGPLGLRGRERFDLLAATPAWLLERHGRDGAVLGRGLLLVFEWDYPRLRSFLARKVEACTARSWPELARVVSRIAEWEGEGAEVIPIR